MPSLLAPMPSSLATACFFSPGRPRSHPPALPIPLPSQVTVSLPRGIHPPSPGNQIPICCGETPCLGCSPASTAIFPCSPCPLEPPKLLCCAKLPSRISAVRRRRSYFQSDTYVLLEPGKGEVFVSEDELKERLKDWLQNWPGSSLPPDLARFKTIDDAVAHLVRSVCELEVDGEVGSIQWYQVRLE